MIDLFGNTITVEQAREIERKGKRSTKLRGYAYPPGTGPAGETCGTCKFACATGGHSKTYHKCEKLRRVWTNGPGTDIRLKSPSCKLWEPYVVPGYCPKCKKELSRFGSKQLYAKCKCWGDIHFVDICGGKVLFPDGTVVEVKS